ncbi:MAG TPA: helix-turn-helix transcriptional regulator [Usitatibacteraceae bacterium]|jgi:excisionase family DNA binding protein|nr:helix-turn-helix transcriptional regulator [Usitatibacteraceae bacterium]HQY46216.1 helix-turn-helix transcriptional regulator [Usitatibacteraceae bacterium]
MPSAPAHLTVAEVARHLRLGTRKVYDLVARKGLPHVRAGGKLLFDVAEVERWLAQSAGGAAPRAGLPPPVVGGSHDPLLEWAVRESRCGLALLTQGSADGLERLSRGEVAAALMHLPSADLADFNRAEADERLRGRGVALVEWARREQGLLVARGNPRKIRAVADLARRGVTVAARQPGAGSAVLLERLLAREGIDRRRLRVTATTMGEGDLAMAVKSGEADVGLGARAAAAPLGLDFVPLVVERLDLGVSRAAWFEAPMRALMAFAHGKRFAEHARSLGGYDISGLGAVTWNDPA